MYCIVLLSKYNFLRHTIDKSTCREATRVEFCLLLQVSTPRGLSEVFQGACGGLLNVDYNKPRLLRERAKRAGNELKEICENNSR